jgi:hypothetical protein
MSAANENTPVPPPVLDSITWLEDNGWRLAEACTVEILVRAASPDHCELTFGPGWEEAHEEAKAFVKQCYRKAALIAPPGTDADGLAKRLLAYLGPDPDEGACA